MYQVFYMSVTAERVVLWLTETSCHFMCVNLFFFSQFCLQTRSLAFLIEFFVGNIDDTFHYQFGQHSIGCGQVFYKTALSFAFVNIKPVLPGRILKKIRLRLATEPTVCPQFLFPLLAKCGWNWYKLNG